MLDKKAQMGEAINWVVATIIIVVILGVSIAVLSFNKDFRKMKTEIQSDVFAIKSVSGYLLTDNVYDNLEVGKLEGDEKDFLEDIFKTIYGNGYFEFKLNIVGTPLSIFSSVREQFKLNNKNVLEVYL